MIADGRGNGQAAAAEPGRDRGLPNLSVQKLLEAMRTASGNVWAVCVSLLSYCTYATGRDCRPGMDNVMKDTNLDRRSVQRAIRELEKRGVFAITYRPPKAGRGRAVVYALKPDFLTKGGNPTAFPEEKAADSPPISEKRRHPGPEKAATLARKGGEFTASPSQYPLNTKTGGGQPAPAARGPGRPNPPPGPVYGADVPTQADIDAENARTDEFEKALPEGERKAMRAKAIDELAANHIVPSEGLIRCRVRVYVRERQRLQDGAHEAQFQPDRTGGTG